MPENTDIEAFRELVRVLEEAARAGVSTIGLEYKGRELIVLPFSADNFRAVTP